MMPTLIVSQLVDCNKHCFQMSVSLGAGSLSLVSVVVVAAVLVPVCSTALLRARARVPRSRHCAHCHRRVLIAGSSVPPHHSNCSNMVEREGMTQI